SGAFPGRQRSGQPLEDLEPAGRGHEGRRGDRRAADHLRRIEPLTTQRAEDAAGLARDDHAGGDVVRALAQKRASLKPVGRHEDLLAAGASQVADPSRERPGIDGPHRVGSEADIVLVMDRFRVAGLELLSIHPGPLPLDGPVQLGQRRDGDDAQDRLPTLDQADADGPERQPMDEVAGAVDRVDRPAARTAAALGRILLTGQTIVRVSLAQAPADQLLDVLIEIGHEAEIRLLDGRYSLCPRNRHGRGLSRHLLDELQFRGKLRLFLHLRLVPLVEFRSVFSLFEWFKGMTSLPGPASDDDDGAERKGLPTFRYRETVGGPFRLRRMKQLAACGFTGHRPPAAGHSAEPVGHRATSAFWSSPPWELWLCFRPSAPAVSDLSSCDSWPSFDSKLALFGAFWGVVTSSGRHCPMLSPCT